MSNNLYKNCILFYRSTNLFKILHCVQARVQGGGAQGAWAPLEIEKQKKKKGFQILGPSPYEFLDTRLLCMLYCMYCIIIMFPSFLIQEKTTLECYVMESQKKLITLKILILICKLFLSFMIITTCSLLANFFVRPYMLTEKVILRKQHQFPQKTYLKIAITQPF